MTAGRIFTKKNIYLYIFILGFLFENRKNSGLTPGQNDDPVTRTVTDDPNDQLTRWHSDPVPCLVCTVCVTQSLDRDDDEVVSDYEPMHWLMYGWAARRPASPPPASAAVVPDEQPGKQPGTWLDAVSHITQTLQRTV